MSRQPTRHDIDQEMHGEFASPEFNLIFVDFLTSLLFSVSHFCNRSFSTAQSTVVPNFPTTGGTGLSGRRRTINRREPRNTTNEILLNMVRVSRETRKRPCWKYCLTFSFLSCFSTGSSEARLTKGARKIVPHHVTTEMAANSANQLKRKKSGSCAICLLSLVSLNSFQQAV